LQLLIILIAFGYIIHVGVDVSVVEAFDEQLSRMAFPVRPLELESCTARITYLDVIEGPQNTYELDKLVGDATIII
jgi:hypothetical protein